MRNERGRGLSSRAFNLIIYINFQLVVLQMYSIDCQSVHLFLPIPTYIIILCFTLSLLIIVANSVYLRDNYVLLRLMEMIEECFDRKPLSDKEKEDQSFHVHPPWFKQPFDETRPHHHQSHAQPLAEHMTPSEVILQLVSNADDLPACLIFYPVAGQPHSIQGTWLASKGELEFMLTF